MGEMTSYRTNTSILCACLLSCVSSFISILCVYVCSFMLVFMCPDKVNFLTSERELVAVSYQANFGWMALPPPIRSIGNAAPQK